jgi:hypothetical protein
MGVPAVRTNLDCSLMLRYRLMQLSDWLRRTPLAWMIFWESTAAAPPPQPLDDQKPDTSHQARQPPRPWGGVLLIALALPVLGWAAAGLNGLAFYLLAAVLVVVRRFRRRPAAG